MDKDKDGWCNLYPGATEFSCTKPKKGQYWTEQGSAFYTDCDDHNPSVTGKSDTADPDEDWVGNGCDNCPNSANGGQQDKDKDGIGDSCDVCPDDPDPKAQKWDYFLDKDKDGIPDLATKNKPQQYCPPPPSGYAAYKGKWDDCDNDKMLTWYWDQDIDNHGNPKVSEQACASPKKINGQGHWILTPSDDECDDPTIKGHDKVYKKTEYYRDKDGDGFLTPIAKKFCTDAEAKKDGYVPKKIPKTEPAKANSQATPQSKVLAIDPTKENLGPNKTTASWDCDDNNPAIKDVFKVYSDADADGFGDPAVVKGVACNEGAATMKDYQSKEGKDGWVTNSFDLSELIPSVDLLNNLRQNPGKFFNSGTTASEPQRCLYSGGAVQCMPVGIVKTFCDAGPKLPFISTADLAFAKVAGVEPASLSSVTACIMRRSADTGAIKLLGPNGQGLLATFFEPMGKGIFALKGDDFSLVTPAYVPTEAVSESVLVALAPYVTTSLSQVVGPVPVDCGANRRRILMDGALGPLKVINSSGATDTKVPDLMLVPWFKLKSQNPKKIPLFTDSDFDGLSDTAELRFGMNPKDADTDGDDYSDMKEYLLGGKTSALAIQWTMVIDTSVINIQPIPDEVAVFNFAKAEAIKIIPATLERLIDMYDGADGVTIDADAEKMQTLISEAQPGISWSYVAMWLESTTAEYILLSEFAHFAPRTRPYAQAVGCGPDAENICVDVLHIAEDNGGELPVYGPISSTIFYSHPIYGLMEALLHEALHYVVDTSVIEPTAVGQNYLEHKIIFDVLGTSDISYMIK